MITRWHLDRWAAHLGVGTDDDAAAVLSRTAGFLSRLVDNVDAVAAPVRNGPDGEIADDVNTAANLLANASSNLDLLAAAFTRHERGTQ